MTRSRFPGAFPLLALLVLVLGVPEIVRGKGATELQWIWFDEGDPTREAPAETRYFRRTFVLDRAVDEATLNITADDSFTVWVNGTEVGRGADWKRVRSLDVKKHLVKGKNVLAVAAHNEGAAAGLLVKLGYIPNGMQQHTLVSDGSWKASNTLAEGWTGVEFDDKKWTAARALGDYGKTGPWNNLTWDAGGDDRFAVPPGFKVQMAATNPVPGDPFSLINMTFDARGRLLVSQENGPVLLCTDPDKDGVFQKVRPYCERVRNCQGMAWVGDALLLVGDGPRGTGLYRCRDTRGEDKIDEAKLMVAVQGGMGEHGPHAILHGPDNSLYLVIGNHAHAKVDQLADNSPLKRWPNGQMGPDQGKPGTTEDVLLPRQNDANGHAANILAPGGTIWRMDHDAKNLTLVAAGFRNHFDAAFSPSGELFTFDSDMEWDESLPWYRAVRVCHCPPGADFVWRTGAANTPNYYIDSLPPTYETGRGSPVGLEFYDHTAFPAKYRGCLFMGDWSLGIIHACFLERSGATYKAKVEKFCTGNPLNVTDLAVGPDGALYFTMGGRRTQGGVYRIAYTGGDKGAAAQDPKDLMALPQPLSAWSRARAAGLWAKLGAGERDLAAHLLAKVPDQKPIEGPNSFVQGLFEQQNLGKPVDEKTLISLSHHESADVRAAAILLLGVNGYAGGKETLIDALRDKDAFVRRRACEALIRAGIEPPVEAIWPLLAEKDPFLSTAARLVLQRIDPKKWAGRIAEEPNLRIAEEAAIALCKTNQAAPYATRIFDRLHQGLPRDDAAALLDYLRTMQMALIHTADRPGSVRGIALECLDQFPNGDWRVNRELAIVLTHLRMTRVLDEPVHAKLLDALLASKDDRQQQIHYFYCLRLLHEGWTSEQKDRLLAWYESTNAWTGGASFGGFLENILRDARPTFTVDDLARVLAKSTAMPLAASVLLRYAPAQELPPPAILEALYGLATKQPANLARTKLKAALVAALSQGASLEASPALRRIADIDPGQRDAIALALARFPDPANWPYLIDGLQSSNPITVLEVIETLRKIKVQPKAEDAAPYRKLLVAARKVDRANRWKVVELLRVWTNGKRFGAEDGDWETELASWGRWFNQAFPKEAVLPDVAGTKPVESKYKFEELLSFVEKDPAGKSGNAERGKAVFTKATCIKCHKYGAEGDAVGPDLTTVSKRFDRKYILESIVYPSKVISDQYRSSVIETKKGINVTGLAAPVPGGVEVLQGDGSKVKVGSADIERQYVSLISVMPEKLLDLLDKQEIADLFAYMESQPK